MFATAISNAQIKVHGDNHISIGSLTTRYGIQVNPSGYTYFENKLNTTNTWVTLAYVNNTTAKCWIVSDFSQNNPHKFFVRADGYVFQQSTLRASDASLQSDTQLIQNAAEILDQITGFWYTPVVNDTSDKPNKRTVGVSAQAVGKVLPEAVIADENDLLYVDYEMFTIFLLEAVKEQREEIQALRSILMENGLIK